MAKDEEKKKKRKEKKQRKEEVVSINDTANETQYGGETTFEPVEEASGGESQLYEPTDEAFSAWYLRKVTIELQDDLDKVRTAGDFKDSSLPILINALKQGEALFSKEEKARVLGREV